MPILWYNFEDAPDLLFYRRECDAVSPMYPESNILLRYLRKAVGYLFIIAFCETQATASLSSDEIPTKT